MITLLLTLLFISTLIHIIINRNKLFYGDISLESIVLVAMYAIAVVAVLACGLGLQTEISRQDIKIPILSLNNKSTIDGSFLLGTGQIQSTEYYFMFSKRQDERIERLQLPVNNSFVLQKENVSPYVCYQVVTYRYSKWVHLWPKLTWTQRTTYDIIVPPNTVIEKYNVF